jgi:hypothetical protein
MLYLRRRQFITLLGRDLHPCDLPCALFIIRNVARHDAIAIARVCHWRVSGFASERSGFALFGDFS